MAILLCRDLCKFPLFLMLFARVLSIVELLYKYITNYFIEKNKELLLYRYQSLAYEGNTWLTVFIFENDLKVFHTTINSSIMALQKKTQETEETYVRDAVDHELQFKNHLYIPLLKLFHSQCSHLHLRKNC